VIVAVACGPAPESDGGQEADTASAADTAAADAAPAAETASAASPATTRSDDAARPAAPRKEPAPSEPAAGGDEAGEGETEEPAAEEAEPTPAERERLTLAAGLQMAATLDDSLDTETLRVGAPFTATVAEPVVQDPYVAVPGGSRVYGRVTEVRQPDGEEPGLIRLALDSIRVRDATSPLAAEITDTQVATRGEMKDEDKKIGGGAAAGALIGAIVGKDVKGAVIGAAAGAAAGTAVALGTKAQYGVLPRGSRLTLRLTEPLEVAAPE